MKEKLIGILIGVAATAALFAAYGFKGETQADNVGRFKLHTTGNVTWINGSGPVSKTYMIDTATGNVWHDSSGNWTAMKRPNINSN